MVLKDFKDPQALKEWQEIVVELEGLEREVLQVCKGIKVTQVRWELLWKVPKALLGYQDCQAEREPQEMLCLSSQVTQADLVSLDLWARKGLADPMEVQGPLESWEHLDDQVGKVTQEILVTLEILVLQGHPVYTVNFRDPQDLQESPGRQEFQATMDGKELRET